MPNPVLCVSINNETNTCCRGLLGVPVLETPSENSTKGIGSEIRKQKREQSTALLTIICIVQNQRIIKYEMLFIGMNEMEG